MKISRRIAITIVTILATAVVTALLSLAAGRDAHARGTFEVSLDEVTLHEPWGAPGEPPAPVHGLLGVRVWRGDTLLDEVLLGRGPDDANLWIWSSPLLIGEGDGLIGPLTPGVPTATDPARFTTRPLDIPDDARLEVYVTLARATWFTEAPVEATALDVALISAFGLALGDVFLTNFGILEGLGVGGVFAALIDLGWDDAAWPCWGLMRDDQLGFDGWKLTGLDRVRVERGGEAQVPRCPRPSLGYVITVRRTSFDFTPVEPGACTLVPVVLAEGEPLVLAQTWVDLGDTWVADVVARLTRVNPLRLAGSLVERAAGVAVSHDGMRAEPEHIDEFRRNYRAAAPWQSGVVLPHSPACAYFSNLDGDPSQAWYPPWLSAGPVGPIDMIFAPDLLDALFGDGGGGGAYAPWIEATTLRFSPEVALHLYAEVQDGRRLGYRLRYVRTAADGSILTNLMLAPGMTPPK